MPPTVFDCECELLTGLTNLAEWSKIKCEFCLFDFLVACVRKVFCTVALLYALHQKPSCRQY